jgi:pyruvate formate lyase activating enzyme
MGRFKWAELGLTYELGGVEPPSPELIERTVATFRMQGLKAY